MNRFWVALAALGLCACGQSSPSSTATTAATPAMPAIYSGPNLCDAKAERVWVRQGGVEYKVDASTYGPNCSEAQATLRIHGADGAVIHSLGTNVSRIIGLKDAADPTAMQAAVTAWLTQTPPLWRNSGDLPDWFEGYLQPAINNRLVFYPEQGATRDAYLAMRAAHLPIFCYAQGRESLACVVLENGQVRKIGVQTIPG